MVKYKCNFCGKADIPTQAGLKVHIQLSKAGCQEAMERQTNRSLSPDLENDAPTSRARQDDNQTPNDSNDASVDHGDISYDDVPPFLPSPRHVDSPEPELAENQHQSKRARVKEVEDEEAYPRYAKEFPTSAEELGDGKTALEEIFEEQMFEGEAPWAPFADKDEWELARWLAKNVNQQATEEFLKLPGVSSST
jgi:hypothetical protein